MYISALFFISWCLLQASSHAATNTEGDTALVFRPSAIFTHRGDLLLPASYWHFTTLLDAASFAKHVLELRKLALQIQQHQSKILPTTQDLDRNDHASPSDQAFAEAVIAELAQLEYSVTHTATVITSRKSRGLINAGGEILNYLFGTATQAETDRLSAALQQVRRNGRAVHHALSLEVSMFNRTQDLLAQHDHRLRELAKKQRDLLATVSTNTSLTIRQLHLARMIQSLEHLLTQGREITSVFRSAVDAILRERMVPSLFPPEHFRDSLREIRFHLQPDLALAGERQSLYSLYRAAKAISGTAGTSLFLTVRIPIVKRTQRYSLYQTMLLPQAFADHQAYLSHEKTEPEFFAISQDNSTYLLLSQNDVDACSLLDAEYICSAEHTSIFTTKHGSCVYALYTSAPFGTDCASVLKKQARPLFAQIGKRAVAYTVPTGTTAHMTCPGERAPSTREFVIDRSGVINMGPSCTLRVADRLFYAEGKPILHEEQLTPFHPISPSPFPPTFRDVIALHSSLFNNSNSSDTIFDRFSSLPPPLRISDLDDIVRSINTDLSTSADPWQWLPTINPSAAVQGSFYVLAAFACVILILFLIRNWDHGHRTPSTKTEVHFTPPRDPITQPGQRPFMPL